jgi:cobalt/nickel transport system permease protein
MTAMSLAFSEEGFMTAAKLVLAAHLPVMAVEGFITAGAVAFLGRVRPELLRVPAHRT